MWRSLRARYSYRDKCWSCRAPLGDVRPYGVLCSAECDAKMAADLLEGTF